MLPRIYFAGPDVFLHNRDDLIKQAHKFSKHYNFECVHPGEFNFSNSTLPEEIRDRCLSAAMECEYTIANVMPWLGCDADPGTAVEIGAALAMKRTVITYGHGPGTVSQRAKGAGFASVLARFLDKPSSVTNEMMWAEHRVQDLESAVKCAAYIELKKGVK